MQWDKWTKITVYGAFIQMWIFIIATTAISVEAARAVNSCSDSDGGIVPGVFGTVSGYYKNKPYSNSDYCVDSGAVLEYYCSGIYKASTQQSCGTDGYTGSNYCMNGDVYRNYLDYFCASGMCASNSTPMLQQDCLYGCVNGTCASPPADSCTDSDGGINTAVQGSTYGYLNASYYSHTDICLNSVTVREYFCSGNYEQNTLQNCTYGCSGGKCNTSAADSCNDTDGGFMITIQGTASGYMSGTPYSHTDSCMNNWTLSEWYCAGNYAYNMGNYTCAGNYTVCLNGKCM